MPSEDCLPPKNMRSAPFGFGDRTVGDAKENNVGHARTAAKSDAGGESEVQRGTERPPKAGLQIKFSKKIYIHTRRDGAPLEGLTTDKQRAPSHQLMTITRTPWTR